MSEPDKKHPYFNASEEESGALGDSDDICEGTTSLDKYIARLRLSKDPVLITRADELEKGLAEGKDYAEIGGLDQKKIRELWSNLPKLDFVAYGGTSYTERMRIGRWGGQETYGLMGDRYAVEAGRISYGIGARGGSCYIILRTILHPEKRGGYPYIILIDFGPEIGESVGWDYALVIQKILEDQELTTKILNSPEGLTKEDFKRLAQAEWKITSQILPSSLKKTVMEAHRREESIVGRNRMSWPKPAELAGVLEQLKPEQRKEFTWLIGGGKGWQKMMGVKMIFDPVHGDYYDSLKY